MGKFEFNAPPNEIQLSHEEAEGLKEDFVRPFRAQSLVLPHIRPEWVLSEDMEAVRIRVMNGGYRYGNPYIDWRKRFCMGVAVIKKGGLTHFFAEIHQPLPKKSPYRVMVAFRPECHELKVLMDEPEQTTIADENPDVLASPTLEETRQIDFEYFCQSLSTLPQYSKYKDIYIEKPGTDNRNDAKFKLPIFQKRPVRLVEGLEHALRSPDVRRMQSLVWSAHEDRRGSSARLAGMSAIEYEVADSDARVRVQRELEQAAAELPPMSEEEIAANAVKARLILDRLQSTE